MSLADVEALKSELLLNNGRAEWCTVVVFAGLLVEYTVLLWLKRKDFSRLEVTLTIIAGLAIAGGVYGEYLFGSKASGSAIKLESVSEQQIASSKEAASQANKEAKLAEERASKNEKDTTGLKTDLARANERAAIAARRETEAELKLEYLRAPRDINGKQFRGLVDKLKPFAGTPYASGVYRDAESIRLLGIINNALVEAGWVRKPPPGVPANSILMDAYDMRDGGPLVPYENFAGIVINWNPGQDDAATALVSALASVGLKRGLTGLRFSSIPGSNPIVLTNKHTPMTIIVGEKPTWYP